MRFQANSAFLALTNFTLRFTYAFRLSPYAGGQCRGAALGSWVGGPDQGCQERLYPGNSASVAISSTGSIDDDFYTVFFSSDDCDPDTEVNDGQGHFDDGCFSGAYNSFAVWDVNAK